MRTCIQRPPHEIIPEICFAFHVSDAIVLQFNYLWEVQVPNVLSMQVGCLKKLREAVGGAMASCHCILHPEKVLMSL